MVTLSKFIGLAQKQPYHDAIAFGKFKSLTSESNKKVWTLFNKAVDKECSTQLVKRLEERYHYSINEKQTSPLLIRHILGVQNALHDPRRSDIPAGIFTRKKLAKWMPKDLPSKHPYKICGGVELKLREMVLPDLVFMDRKRLQLYSGIENLKRDAFLQRIAMALISLPLAKGMIIPAPDGKGKRDYYEIAYLGGREGLEICALAPIAINSKLKTIIVLQPTQWSFDKQGIPTLINDFEPDPGSTGYNASGKVIKKIMNDRRFSRGDVSLTAYSLGGNHAQRLLNDYTQSFERVVFFNDYSPLDEIGEKIAKTMNSDKWKKPVSIQYYYNVLTKDGKIYRDPTPSFSGKHAGYGIKNPLVDVRVSELHYETDDVSILNRHTKRLLDCNPEKHDLVKEVVFTGSEVDQKLGSAKRNFLETLRGYVSSYFVHPILRLSWDIWRWLSKMAVFFFFGHDKDKD